MKSLITTIGSALSHMFYPHHCIGCGTDRLSSEQSLCNRCFYQLPVTDFFKHADNPVEKTFWGRIPIKAAGSWVYFSKRSTIQQMLHALKYHGNELSGSQMGRAIGNVLLESTRFHSLEGIVPLPLYPSREKQRGYNQATLIANGIGEILNLPVYTKAIQRKRATSTQTKKNRAERWTNMYNGFEVVYPDIVTKKQILLVDDVITTGASLESCGQCLISAGVEDLYIATVAYTTK